MLPIVLRMRTTHGRPYTDRCLEQPWLGWVFSLLVYSFELKSAFGAGCLLAPVSLAVCCVLWLNHRPTSYSN